MKEKRPSKLGPKAEPFKASLAAYMKSKKQMEGKAMAIRNQSNHNVLETDKMSSAKGGDFITLQNSIDDFSENKSNPNDQQI